MKVEEWAELKTDHSFNSRPSLWFIRKKWIMYIRLFINRQDFYLCTPMNAVSFTDTLSARRHQPVLVPTDQHSIADTGANAKKDPSSLPKTPWKQHNWAFSWSPYLMHIPWRASDSHGLTTSSKHFFFFFLFTLSSLPVQVICSYLKCWMEVKHMHAWEKTNNLTSRYQYMLANK